MGKAELLYVLPPFAVGKFISDGIMIVTGKYAAGDIREMFHGNISPKTIIMLVLGLVTVSAVLFVDWQAFFEKKKLKFRWRIWKGQKENC